MAAMLVTLSLLAVRSVAPALADPAPPAGESAGNGSLQGTEAVDNWDWTGKGLCIQTQKSIYALAGIGTYEGRTDSGQPVVYKAEINSTQTLYGDGPIKVQVASTQPYYYGPYGTHGTTDASCTPATAGTPIDADFRIFATDHVYELDNTGAQVPCKGHGTFERGVQNSTTNGTKWYAEWTLTEPCTVVGNAAGTPGTGIAPVQTVHTDSGTHDPCFSGSCVDNFKVDYHQYLPYKGLHVTVNGPASAVVGTTAVVTAAVTND
jgi:hypothetical protein